MIPVEIELHCFDCNHPQMVTIKLSDEALLSIEAFVASVAPFEDRIKTRHRFMHAIHNDYWHDIVTTWPILPDKLQLQDQV